MGRHRAAWNKLVTRLGREPSPEAFLTLSDQQLRDAGLSRQKIHYGRTLAEAVLNRVLTGQTAISMMPQCVSV